MADCSPCRGCNDFAYLLLGFPLALTAFVVVITLLALGMGLLAIFVGVFVMVGTVFAARAFAMMQRRMAHRFLGVPAPEPAYRVPTRSGVRGTVTSLGDPQSWLDTLHTMVGFPVATLAPLTRLMALLQGGLAQVLLCTRAEIQQRVTTLEQSRASAGSAQSSDLRRLERDILRSRSAGSGRPPASWSSPSTSNSPTPTSCSARATAGSATC